MIELDQPILALDVPPRSIRLAALPQPPQSTENPNGTLSVLKSRGKELAPDRQR